MDRLLVFAVVFGALALAAQAEDRVEFNRDIRPILSENCFYCHGFDETHREAGLRLDTSEGATSDLGGYQALVPGDVDTSELMTRILSDDGDLVMPPPDTEKRLTEGDKERIAKWIAQGAEYQEHWAWRVLARPAVPGPAVGDASAAAAIDAFLETAWKANGAQSVVPATPRQRLRRLSLDLRGLLPTANEVATFEREPTDEQFLRMRDRWMSELAYAEHQALRWLDLVRWADTSGFVSDEPIASGAYRAWIIQAIQKNQPFDQFSIEQLAGDLLPDPTDDQFIASGYNRIVNTNCEAGGIEEEQLYKLKGEHVRAFGTVWLGMTTGCAECHDHKFDPFSAKDYYSLAAFFDDLIEAGVYTPGDRREPLHYAYHNASSDKDAKLVEEIAALKRRMSRDALPSAKDVEVSAVARLKDQKSRCDFVWIPALLPAPRILEGSFSEVDDNRRLVRQTAAGDGKFHRHHVAELMTGYLNTGGNETDKALDAWFVDVWLDEENRPDMIGLQISNGRYGRLGWQPASYETYHWGDDTSGTLSKDHVWSAAGRVKRMGELPQESGWVRLRVPFEQLIKPVSGKSFEKVGIAWLHTGGRVLWGDSGLELRTDKATALALGETAIRKWWEQPYNRQFYQSRAESVASAFKTAPEKRNELQQELVADGVREWSQPLQMAELRRLESRLFVLRSRALPVLVSRQSDRRKITQLLKRGDYQDKSGPIMSPAVPEFLAGSSGRRGLGHASEGAETDKGLTASTTLQSRLDLANWLFADGHPLAARVFVNRLWHQFYGRGLSETLEDAGTQGDWPSHVALLDWLACEFRDSDWDRNHMVRLLTSTQAYQLSSKPTPDLVQRDPGNRWHARQGRFRLTAEAIRDASLQAAGLLQLSDEVPTHSFFPYQPIPYWSRSDKIMYGSRHMIWATSANRGQYHRSLYTFWKRQNIHPTMLAFDAPTRQECTAKRNITNTPGQALALLNDPIFVETARVLATRICEDTAASTDERLGRLFAITLQREPSAAEKTVLDELLKSQLVHYQQHPEEARRLTAIGQAPPPPTDLERQVAAWTAVTRSVLNLHEFLNRQ
jgi:hypothetical protein